MDVRATIEALRDALGVDEVQVWCLSHGMLETAWVAATVDGVRISDRGETHRDLGDEDRHPPDTVVRGICERYGVEVVPAEEYGYVLQRDVAPGGDLRAAVRAVLGAQDAIFAAADESREAGGRWDGDVLEAGRRRELSADDA